MRAERFRLCANWEIDIRYHWDAGERHRLQKHYQVEVIRDQLESDAIAERKEEKAEKKAKRSSKDETDAVSVAQAVRKNPDNAPRTIADKLRMSPSRFERLAELAGLTWDKEPRCVRVRRFVMFRAYPASVHVGGVYKHTPIRIRDTRMGFADEFHT